MNRLIKFLRYIKPKEAIVEQEKVRYKQDI